MTYTDDELKEWFKIMKNKYPNSKMYEHLESVEFEMFNGVLNFKNSPSVLNLFNWIETS